VGGAFEAEHRDLGVEVVGGLERAVDRGEAEVGHLVERPERGEDRQADVVGVELGVTGEAQRVLDLLAEAGELVVGDRAALAGLADAGDRLAPVERLGRAGALEHRQLDLLDRGEAAVARGARAAAADRATVVGDAGVEDLGVLVLAVGTVHAGPPSGRCSRARLSALDGGPDVDSAVDNQLQGVGETRSPVN
jgi:hypothetical protein